MVHLCPLRRADKLAGCTQDEARLRVVHISSARASSWAGASLVDQLRVLIAVVLLVTVMVAAVNMWQLVEG
jgi:hypothetical protein